VGWLVSCVAAALALGVVAVGPACADPAPAFRLMTYNVEYDNADLPATLDAIAAADADVVVLQEITQRWQDALAARFTKQYPHRMFHLHTRYAGGLAILSKLPIKSRESYESPSPGWFPADRMIVSAPFGDVQILNVHLRPAIENGSWLRGYVTTPPLRLGEITAYWKHVDPRLPTIVAGDFNEAPTGTAVAFLEKQGLARAATSGPPTWHYEQTVRGAKMDLLSFDLDHVMLRGLVARDGKVLDAGTSDHRPVVVTIARE
jgi:endonuclease/exonuclease/phosphatase (EEP) superfamily protein YafD